METGKQRIRLLPPIDRHLLPVIIEERHPAIDTIKVADTAEKEEIKVLDAETSAKIAWWYEHRSMFNLVKTFAPLWSPPLNRHSAPRSNPYNLNYYGSGFCDENGCRDSCPSYDICDRRSVRNK